MANLINNFFESKYVKVYPAAFRGNHNNIQFDPESRMPTEYNLIHIGGSNNNTTKSFIVDWDSTTGHGVLKCVIGGYYFEFTEIPNLDIFKINGAAGYLVIKLREIDLFDGDSSDSKRTTAFGYNVSI